ncbi:MAG: alkaline phosphatase, partial [Akkermansiaceae bacterium]|nr:alkaline phosphatase [Akkermansiaceae bacterium]
MTGCGGLLAIGISPLSNGVPIREVRRGDCWNEAEKERFLITPIRLPMNILRSIPLPLSAVAALLTVSPASAVVLFTDNYTVTANMNDTNFDLANPGRQGGTLATPTLSYSDLAPGGYEQVGNTSTFAGNPNALLLDNGGTTYINYNFASIPTAISISFDRIIASGNPDLSDWVSLQVNSAAGAGPGVTGADFGILFRGNGGIQVFDGGSDITGSGTAGPGARWYADDGINNVTNQL